MCSRPVSGKRFSMIFRTHQCNQSSSVSLLSAIDDEGARGSGDAECSHRCYVVLMMKVHVVLVKLSVVTGVTLC